MLNIYHEDVSKPSIDGVLPVLKRKGADFSAELRGEDIGRCVCPAQFVWPDTDAWKMLRSLPPYGLPLGSWVGWA